MTRFLPPSLGSTWNEIWEIREVRAVVLIAGLLVTIAALIYAVLAIRDLLVRRQDDRIDPVEDLEMFREMSRSGAIEGDEYQRVRVALARRVRESDSPQTALTMTEMPSGSVRQTLPTDGGERDSVV